MTHNFKELKIWQLGLEIARLSYKITRTFPDEEKYVLTSQMRRAAISIPSNIAEGSGRGTDSQFCHFLDISLGSSCELETQMILAFEFNYFDKTHFETFNELTGEFRRRTRSFKSKLQNQTR